MKDKKIVEKKTGEKYASKAAMAKHEKKESKAVEKKEMAKGSPMKQSKVIKTAAPTATKPRATAQAASPAMMKKKPGTGTKGKATAMGFPQLKSMARTKKC